VIELISAHRRALADALDELTAEQWRGETLCAGWTPAHVLAHQTMPFRISGEDFMAGMQRCGGDFTTYSNEVADRDSRIPPAELVAALRDNAGNPWSPPGGGQTSALSHDVIHGLDIGWPFELEYEIPDRAMTIVLDAITSPLTLGPDDAVAAEIRPGARSETLFGFSLDGIRVRATDLDWSTGEGAELTGHSRDLLMLLAARRVPGDRFAGPAAARFAAPAR
jgi:uncharacterized protein (TIGR03083 family)